MEDRSTFQKEQAVKRQAIVSLASDQRLSFVTDTA